MTDQEMIDKVNSLVASQCVLKHLALALFDAIDDKTRVIQQFDETTNKTHNLSLESGSKAFLSTFEQYRKTILESLVDVKASIGPHNGAC